MSEPRKPGPILPIAVTLAVLLGLYVGAYYLMVQPLGFSSCFHCPVDAVVPGYPFTQHKHVGSFWDELDSLETHRADSRWEPFFRPAHQLDRCIRPHVWEPTL